MEFEALKLELMQLAGVMMSPQFQLATLAEEGTPQKDFIHRLEQAVRDEVRPLVQRLTQDAAETFGCSTFEVSISDLMGMAMGAMMRGA